MDECLYTLGLFLYQLCRRSYGAHENPDSLTQSQAMALCYFYRANRISRTVSGFAAFNGTTLGTASLVIESLVRKGYVTRQRSALDRRVIQVDLTERGRELGAGGPLEELARAFSQVDETDRNYLLSLLDDVLYRVAGETDRFKLGVCRNCRFLSQNRPSLCKLYDISLGKDELGQLCMKFEGRHQV